MTSRARERSAFDEIELTAGAAVLVLVDEFGVGLAIEVDFDRGVHAHHVQMATDTRMDVEHIVTEYGCVNLRGKSTRDRAMALISIAHPNFREELTAYAKSITLI